MIELVFTACLAAAPAECRESSLTFAGDVTPMACLMNAQGELARWGEAHPKWRIACWRCRHAAHAAKRA